jgi:hypothetical protein
MLKDQSFEVHTEGSDAMPVLTTSSETYAETTDRALTALDILSGNSAPATRPNPARRRAGGAEDYERQTSEIDSLRAEQERIIANILRIDTAPISYDEAMGILIPKGGAPLYSDKRESIAARDRIAEAYNTLEDLLVVLGARRIAESLTRERLQGQIGDPYVAFFTDPRITEGLIGSGLFTELDYIDDAESVTFDTLSEADQNTLLAGLRFFSCFFDISTTAPTSALTLPVFRAFAILQPQDRAAVIALFKDAQFSQFANSMGALGGHDGIPTMYALYAIMFFKDALFGTGDRGKRRSFKDAVIPAVSGLGAGATLSQVLRAAFQTDVDAACLVYQGSAFPLNCLDISCRVMGTYTAETHRAPLDKLFQKNEFEAPNALSDVVLRVFGVAYCISRMKDSQLTLTETRLVGVEATAVREKKVVDGVEYVQVRYKEHTKLPNSEAGYAIALITAKTTAPKKISTRVLYESYILGQNAADIHYFEWCALLFENFLARGKPLTVPDADYAQQQAAIRKCLAEANIDRVCGMFDRIRADRGGAAYKYLSKLGKAMEDLVTSTSSDKYSETDAKCTAYRVSTAYSKPDSTVDELAQLGLVEVASGKLKANPNNVVHLACLMTILAEDMRDFSRYVFTKLNNEPMPTTGTRYEFWKSVKHNPLSGVVGMAEISGCCVRPGNWGTSCAISALFVGDLDYNVVTFAIDAPTKSGGLASDFYGIFTHYALSWTDTDLAAAIRGRLNPAVLASARKDGCAITPGAVELDFTLSRRDLRTELGDAILENRPYAPPPVVSVFDNREAGVANNLKRDLEDLKLTYLEWLQGTDHMKQIGVVAQERREPAKEAFDAIRPQTMHELKSSLPFKQATKTYTDNDEFKYLLRSTLGEMLVSTADQVFTNMHVRVNADRSAEVTYDDLPPISVQPDYLLYMFSWPKGPKFMPVQGSIEFACAADVEAFVLDTLMFPTWFHTPLVRDGRTITYDKMVSMRMPRGGLVLNGNRITL